MAKFILSRNSTCFGHLLCPSSGVLYCTFGTGIFHTGLKIASKQGQDGQIYFVKKFHMFRAFPLPIIRSFLLYVRHWYISYRCEDNFQAGSGWPNLFCQETPHVSGISSVHHQEFSTVHSALVYFIQW